MKVSIYQVKISHDELNIAFRNLANIQTICNGKVPEKFYERVFTGEVDAKSLEEVYFVFNVDHPPGYRGRSLSQSDIVEMYDENNASKYYFCDTYSFVPVDFDGKLCLEGNGI